MTPYLGNVKDVIQCGRCMDIVPSLNADGMCDGCVEETNSQEELNNEV
jgi:hypothetical protein